MLLVIISRTLVISYELASGKLLFRYGLAICNTAITIVKDELIEIQEGLIELLMSPEETSGLLGLFVMELH